MGVTGLGVDIVEIERMEAILERTPAFRMRAFSQTERDYCDAKARPAVHYALRFAAKEAVLKSLGTGFSGVRVTDVEIVNDALGKPEAVLHGQAKRIAEEQGVQEIPVSLSYTHSVCVANAVAITDERRPRVESRPDPKAQLAAAFKEARSLLDDMGAPKGSMDTNLASAGDAFGKVEASAGEHAPDEAGAAAGEHTPDEADAAAGEDAPDEADAAAGEACADGVDEGGEA